MLVLQINKKGYFMSKLLSGADFDASEAVSLGLADGMATLDECVANVFVRADFK